MSFRPAAVMSPTAGATILPGTWPGVFSGASSAGGRAGPGLDAEDVPPGGGVDDGALGGLLGGLTAGFISPFCGWTQRVIRFPWPSVKALQRIKIQSIAAQMTHPNIKNPSRIPVTGCPSGPKVAQAMIKRTQPPKAASCRNAVQILPA